MSSFHFFISLCWTICTISVLSTGREFRVVQKYFDLALKSPKILWFYLSRGKNFVELVSRIVDNTYGTITGWTMPAHALFFFSLSQLDLPPLEYFLLDPPLSSAAPFSSVRFCAFCFIVPYRCSFSPLFRYKRARFAISRIFVILRRTVGFYGTEFVIDEKCQD